MAEVLVEFTDPVITSDGRRYIARACGAAMDDGMWQGWVEFVPIDDTIVLRSSRETTQPNRQDALYWATGLTSVYLEGALERALKPLERPTAAPIAPPMFDEPAPPFVSPAPPNESVLNPFSVYRKGEALLRSQLAALSPWHLVNIIRAYELSEQDTRLLNLTPAPVLIELIVTSVREQIQSGMVR